MTQGQGVILKKEGGLGAGDFVGEYLGELYSPWSWSERQVRVYHILVITMTLWCL